MDEAIEVLRQAVAALPADDPNQALYLSNLGDALRDRFERSGMQADIDEAIEVLRQAVAALPADDPNQALYLFGFGLALEFRFERSGALADIDEAIEVLRQAVAALLADDPKRAMYLSLLGYALRSRFERSGTQADLDEAIKLLRQAAQTTPADNPHRAVYLSDLGGALQDRFKRSGTLADLDETIKILRQAIAANPERAASLSELGSSFLIRYQWSGALADLDEAIKLLRQAVTAAPADHPNQGGYLSYLGGALQARFDRSELLADLDEAIEVLRQAVTATPADHPGQGMHSTSLGNALHARFEETQVLADLDEAINVHRRAVAVETAPPSTRTMAARGWGSAATAREDWIQAVEGYAAAVKLLGELAPRSLGRTDQEYQLTQMAGLGSEAAACCLQLHEAERAVELWEQGRGVLLGQALDTRTDLTSLAEQNAGLADRFARLREDLDRVPDMTRVPATSALRASTADGGDVTELRREIDRRLELAEQFDRIVAEVRDLPTFRHFLLPAPVDELLSAADHGPVVLVNVSDIRSDALLLRSSGVDSVPLPELNPQTVLGQVEEFLAAHDNAHDAAAPESVRNHGEVQLSNVLGWLWDSIACPVLDRLAITSPPNRGQPYPHLWWAASGMLSFLPLHAAGHHHTRFDANPQTVIDRAVSSYTPTVRALIHARRQPRATVEPRSGQVVVVAMPQTPDAGDLPGAADEATLLQSMFQEAAAILQGPKATHDTVRAVLPHYPWAHFACHGSSDLYDPSASHLLLRDYRSQPLTVVDIARLRLDDADLAFLSACSTARSGADLADEAIHLASAFQLAGYRHVIATLRPVGDRPAVRVATDVYTRLVRDGTVHTAADALHDATRRLRAMLADYPSVWAAHIHSGA